MGQAGPGPGNGPSRRVVEVVTAVVVAVVVASGVVAVGAATRDDPQNTADPEPSDSSSEEPDTAEPESTPLEKSPEPEDESTQEKTPTAGPAVEAEVTSVELGVDQPEYTGRCPVTLTFSGRIETNTGPLLADYEWQDADRNEVEGDVVQFGGPGSDAEPVPQGVTVTHEVEVTDDATVLRTLEVIDPNVVTSNTVEATVACTPYAEITKGGDDFDAGSDLCHTLHFEATITVPHDMTVTYEWLRSDGATDRSGPHTVEFNGGGMQTRSIPGQTWNLGNVNGEYGYELHITEPYDLLSNPAAYEVNGCSEPAT